MTPQRLTAIVAMLSAFPVNADELVDRADANGDGYVSLYELRAAYYADMEFNRRIEQSFADYDTDGDGLISEAERQAQAVATAETAPGAGMAATASGETCSQPPGDRNGTSHSRGEWRSAPAAVPVATASGGGAQPTPAAGLLGSPSGGGGINASRGNCIGRDPRHGHRCRQVRRPLARGSARHHYGRWGAPGYTRSQPD